MLTRIFFILYLSFIFILTGCSISSQNRSISPHFNGILQFNGKPVANTKIMLSLTSGDKSCRQSRDSTLTNPQGKFNLKAIIEEYTYTPFVNYKLDEWVICANYNNQIYTLYLNNRYGSGNVTGSIYLECDLVKSSPKPCIVSH